MKGKPRKKVAATDQKTTLLRLTIHLSSSCIWQCSCYVISWKGLSSTPLIHSPVYRLNCRPGEVTEWGLAVYLRDPRNWELRILLQEVPQCLQVAQDPNTVFSWHRTAQLQHTQLSVEEYLLLGYDAGVISQKKILFKTTAVKTSNPTTVSWFSTPLTVRPIQWGTMDRPQIPVKLLHLPLYHSVYSPPVNEPLFAWMLALITFICKKCFGLVDIGQTGLEGNWTVGRKREVLSTVIPTIHVASFCGLYSFS
jgi:hypothetical protein